MWRLSDWRDAGCRLRVPALLALNFILCRLAGCDVFDILNFCARLCKFYAGAGHRERQGMQQRDETAIHDCSRRRHHHHRHHLHHHGRQCCRRNNRWAA